MKTAQFMRAGENPSARFAQHYSIAGAVRVFPQPWPQPWRNRKLTDPSGRGDPKICRLNDYAYSIWIVSITVVIALLTTSTSGSRTIT
jgi:hypothetical protein